MTDDKPAKKTQNVHAGFRDAADANTDLMIQSLLDGLDATKVYRAKCPNPRCGRDVNVPGVPDMQARGKAVELLVALGHGKPRNDDTPTANLDLRYEYLPTDEAKAQHRQALLRLASPTLLTQLPAVTALPRD